MTPSAAHQGLLLAVEKKSAEVSDWGGYLLWTGILLAFVAAVYLLMWRAWKKRGRRQESLPPLPQDPAGDGVPLLPVLEGRYFGTTTAGDWLDRVVAHGLGTRSTAALTLTAEGVRVERGAAAAFSIPAGALVSARHEKGIAGKVLPEGGLLVLTWRHGDATLDSGFRSHHPDEHDTWIEAVTRLAAGDVPVPAVQNNQEGSVQ